MAALSNLVAVASFIFLVTLVAAVGLSGASAQSESPSYSLVSRIAFGSCSNQSASQPIWDAIIDFDPQLFIWLGDNIYGDNKRPFRVFGKERTIGPWKNVPRFFPSTEEEMRKRYHMAKTRPGYSKLREKAQIIGTWDDHDYGLNDAGREFSGKDTNQRLLLDFLDEPENSPRRKQAGVYASYTFGPKGRQVKVILLDTRYHKDPQLSDGTILGSSQWEWLQVELNGLQSEITIIASSIHVISNLSAAAGPFVYTEAWGWFPKERARVFQLINDSKIFLLKYNRNTIFFISGDVHFGEIARYDCGAQYPLYDITSSGITQAVENYLPPLVASFVRGLAWLIPTTMRVFSSKCWHRSCTYGRPNFGAIEIVWNALPPILKVEVRDVGGDAVTTVEILLSELQPKKVGIPSKEAYEYHCTLEIELPWFYRYRLAILLFFILAGLVGAFVLLLWATVLICQKFSLKFKND